MNTITIYTDGSALPNPGKLGVAAVLVATDTQTQQIVKVKTVKQAFAYGTNQQAELAAALIGLTALTGNRYPVTVVSDSQYLVRTMNSDYRRGSNFDLWNALDKVIAAKDLQVTWQWVKGHAGNQFNEHAHKAAQAALGYQEVSKLEELWV